MSAATISIGRVNHLRDCTHDLTKRANAACRTAKLERAQTIANRTKALMDSAERLGMERYLSRAAYRLGLAKSPDCGYIFAARQLAGHRSDMGGGVIRDGVTWRNVMWMFS